MAERRVGRRRVTEHAAFDDRANRYDALLIVSFGGPEGLADVAPFLDNVLRGLKLPDSAKQRIAKRYEGFGGVSPINAHTRRLIGAVRAELEAHGPALPIYWGNRNWRPLLPDALKQMEAAGVRRAMAFVTSMFGSYSGCRRYREDLHDASDGLRDPPHIDKVRLGYNHPGFVGAFASRVGAALAKIPAGRRESAPILFTAHSLPDAMARRAPYRTQLRESCVLVSAALGHAKWSLAYQSRNANYGGEEWLGPDVGDALAAAKDQGARDVVVAPIGFVCDHMEVVLDLDCTAKQQARELGLKLVRAETVGDHPEFVGMIGDLVRERMSPDPARAALGAHGPSPDYCPPDCCLSGRPGAPRPAMCGGSLPAR